MYIISASFALNRNIGQLTFTGSVTQCRLYPSGRSIEVYLTTAIVTSRKRQLNINFIGIVKQTTPNQLGHGWGSVNILLILQHVRQALVTMVIMTKDPSCRLIYMSTHLRGPGESTTPWTLLHTHTPTPTFLFGISLNGRKLP